MADASRDPGPLRGEWEEWRGGRRPDRDPSAAAPPFALSLLHHQGRKSPTPADTPIPHCA